MEDVMNKNFRFSETSGNTPARGAFTLAEVLITLGIIGIVAAITLPNLIANYQKKVYVTRLKKAVNITQNACKMALADDEVSDFSDTRLFKAFASDATSEDNTILKNYFNTDSFGKVHGGTNYSGSMTDVEGHIYLLLNDGTNFYLLSHTDLSILDVIIDVNGYKKLPNIEGRDIFRFGIDDNCKYYISEVDRDRDCSEDINDGHVAAAPSCFQKIVKDNWEMKY